MSSVQRTEEMTGTLDFSSLILLQLSFRFPQRVSEVKKFQTSCGYTTYPVCPRCHITLDCEYVAFCNRCGQNLDWAGFAKAKVVYPRGAKRAWRF